MWCVQRQLRFCEQNNDGVYNLTITNKLPKQERHNKFEPALLAQKREVGGEKSAKVQSTEPSKSQLISHQFSISSRRFLLLPTPTFSVTTFLSRLFRHDYFRNDVFLTTFSFYWLPFPSHHPPSSILAPGFPVNLEVLLIKIVLFFDHWSNQLF